MSLWHYTVFYAEYPLRYSARSGRLRVRVLLPATSLPLLGTHCALPEIQFLSRIHPMRPTVRDPYTAATVEWLLQFDGPLSDAECLTFLCMGKLRQAASVKLLVSTSGNYLGFTSLDTPERLGKYIAMQDTIVWGQQLTQEMLKLPKCNSFRASTVLSSIYAFYNLPGTLMAKLQQCETYLQMVMELKTIPGQREFISKNVVETILNAIAFSGKPASTFGHWCKACVDDYLADPEAVLGPGPDALGKLIFGDTFDMSNFDEVHTLVNKLLADVRLTVDSEPMTIEQCIRKPPLQALWCKLVSGLRNYAGQHLGAHARKDSQPALLI